MASGAPTTPSTSGSRRTALRSSPGARSRWSAPTARRYRTEEDSGPPNSAGPSRSWRRRDSDVASAAPEDPLTGVPSRPGLAGMPHRNALVHGALVGTVALTLV